MRRTACSLLRNRFLTFCRWIWNQPPFLRESPKLDPSRFLRVQLQPELLYPLPRVLQECFRLFPVLELRHGIVRVADRTILSAWVYFRRYGALQCPYLPGLQPPRTLDVTPRARIYSHLMWVQCCRQLPSGSPDGSDLV